MLRLSGSIYLGLHCYPGYCKRRKIHLNSPLLGRVNLTNLQNDSLRPRYLSDFRIDLLLRNGRAHPIKHLYGWKTFICMKKKVKPGGKGHLEYL